jgi:hypothetical protein
MDWLKGLVGSTGGMIPAGQQPPAAWTPYQPQGQQQPGGPPMGGAPQPAWGGPPQQPMQGAPGGADARVAALEARCEQLRGDIESIALFARTLLTVLEEKQVTNAQHFQEVKKKLDLLDGKLDDR